MLGAFGENMDKVARKRWMLGCPIGLISAILLIWFLTLGEQARMPPPAKFDLTEGSDLYQGYCADCHGAELEGQPDWQSPGTDDVFPAPPHDETGHTWHHSDATLFDYTKWGGAETLARQGVDFASGMPGFGDDLTDDQIRNILAFIKSTWPQEKQNAQARRSAKDTEASGL
ncbi:Cytochrome c, mono-and diheme variants [Roseovarius nanhaiticus]|uniref:Cytochrome c, mono-and diheme variants n=2 Tax=Roseobacteraceae TaxID=2854170 RepID=A0A1N7EW51_9RHOB|nr:Cytochrome c, mono-and diheme variants [Roseovarius nanhaiticus]SIR92336.1 Cytochrome c, mono-and diheme variants [Roseovarius nanhaiticus]